MLSSKQMYTPNVELPRENGKLLFSSKEGKGRRILEMNIVKVRTRRNTKNSCLEGKLSPRFRRRHCIQVLSLQMTYPSKIGNEAGRLQTRDTRIFTIAHPIFLVGSIAGGWVLVLQKGILAVKRWMPRKATG